MFNPNHKLYYHNDDLNIFSMAHSIAPSGYFESIIEGKNTHIELDRRKVYTKSTIDTLSQPRLAEQKSRSDQFGLIWINPKNFKHTQKPKKTKKTKKKTKKTKKNNDFQTSLKVANI